MTLPDIVIPSRPGQNEELRYALRSTSNIPHRTVWTAGEVPSWCRTQHIPVDNPPRKLMARWVKHQALLNNPDAADEVIFWDDDMFLMQPTTRIWPAHVGSITDHLNRATRNVYIRGLAETGRLLNASGHPDPLSYFHHFPRTVDRQAALDVFKSISTLPLATAITLDWYTIYGNHHHIGGIETFDAKIHGHDPGPFDRYGYLSTNDYSFEAATVGEFIRSRFPNPSPYEA